MYIRAFFIIGFPGESKDEIFESVRFMKEAGFNWVAIMIATPIAGSELFKICREDNLLLSDKMEDFHYGKCTIKLSHSSPEEIEELRYLINLEVNFVENYDLKNGREDLALVGFEDVIKRVADHAFAHYFSSMCYRKLKDLDRERKSMDRYFEIIKDSPYWAGYARHFGLPLS